MLTSLRCTHWRNLHFKTLNLSSKTVFLVGDNGQGKTNLLEAIYYLIYQSSWRPFDIKTLSAEGTYDGFGLEGIYELKGQPPLDLSLKQESNVKILTKEGKVVRDRSELLQVQAPLIFSPADLAILQGSPARRRDFLDQTLTLWQPSYLADWRHYARVLAHRNVLLRSDSLKELEAFDAIFAGLALQLIHARKRLIDEWGKELPFYTGQFLKEWQTLSLEYETNLSMSSEEEMREFLMKKRENERARGFSLYGPHRDRFTLKREGVDVSLLASNGQMRALALSLRLMQARLLADQSGRLPTLLLDDVLLELDAQKREIFFRLLPPYEQAFFTFLPDEPFRAYGKEDTLLYRVKAGVFSQEGL